MPLLSLTARVAALGFATVALLEVLAGCWVSVLQYRRRTLSLLDTIYVAQRGRETGDIVQLAPCLVDELWTLTIVGPIVVTDIRAQSLPEVFLADASEKAQAVVQCDVPRGFKLRNCSATALAEAVGVGCCRLGRIGRNFTRNLNLKKNCLEEFPWCHILCGCS